MDETQDNEYLSRPLLQDVKYYTGSDKIKIGTSSTSFIDIERNKYYITLAELLSLYKKVIGEAKLRNISISYTRKYKQIISDNYTCYSTEYNLMQKLFYDLIKLSITIQMRGIHYGNVDDIVLEEMIKKRNEYISYFWRTSAYSKINSVYQELKILLKNITSASGDITKIYI